MMAAEKPVPALIDRLPGVHGRLRADAALAPHTWFRVGGPAEILFRPDDLEDLAEFMAACPPDVPVVTVGMASNLLIRDGGIPGVVIRLGGQFARVRIDGDRIIASGGALDLTVAQEALVAGLGGLEFLSGIPGTIGGAVKMNAGAYGREMVDIIESATIVTREGRVLSLDRVALGLGYRRSNLPEGAIVVDATLRATPADVADIAARMQDIQTKRAETQPIRARTGGSTFANPSGAKAWELIDRAGCRGLTVGGAQVSEQHCNFLINLGEASASDLELLGEEVRRRVRAACGVDLIWEIKRIGVPK